MKSLLFSSWGRLCTPFRFINSREEINPFFGKDCLFPLFSRHTLLHSLYSSTIPLLLFLFPILASLSAGAPRTYRSLLMKYWTEVPSRNRVDLLFLFTIICFISVTGKSFHPSFHSEDGAPPLFWIRLLWVMRRSRLPLSPFS